MAFIYFSCDSLIGFIHGDVVYNVVNENNVKPGFPSLTLCPYYKKKIVNLKTDKLQSDFDLIGTDTDGFNIFMMMTLLKNMSFLLDNYSFTLNDTFLKSSVM